MLDDFLEGAADVPVMDMQGASFSRFMALAVKGETEAALAELQMVAELGWTGDWWLLNALEFDPDYARLMANPRFQKIQADLEARVRVMRESYLANPDLPADQLRRAGILRNE